MFRIKYLEYFQNYTEYSNKYFWEELLQKYLEYLECIPNNWKTFRMLQMLYLKYYSCVWQNGFSVIVFMLLCGARVEAKKCSTIFFENHVLCLFSQTPNSIWPVRSTIQHLNSKQRTWQGKNINETKINFVFKWYRDEGGWPLVGGEDGGNEYREKNKSMLLILFILASSVLK